MKAASEDRRPAYVVSLHDVSPTSWPLYRDFLGWLDELDGVRCSLLVVPDFHHRSPVADDGAFCEAMSSRQARGDELVLHGLTHTDDAMMPLWPGDVLRRRILTHEGEFAALNRVEAAARIHAGQALCRDKGWRMSGFVPPGWMTSPESREAIKEAGFHYRTDTGALYLLPTGRRVPMPTLVMSSGSAWRRRLFVTLNHWRLHRYRHAPMIRLALHPVDLEYASSRQFWIDVITELHGERRSLTKMQWLNELRDAAPALGVAS